MKNLYRFRGFLLGILAIALWIFPHSGAWIPASSALLALFGIAVRIEARRVIGEHSRTNELDAPSLVTFGIYSKVRHPLYLSNLCFCYAFILFHLGWQPAAFAFATIATLLEFSLAAAEDRFLEKKFGAFFLEWKKSTPMFFPSGISRRSNSAGKISVIEAFAHDRWTWIWLLFYTFALIGRRYVDLPIPF